jgi:hypothetical protein
MKLASLSLLIVVASLTDCFARGGHADGFSTAQSASNDGTEIRRICLQNGIGGIGGGSIVRLVGNVGAGNLTVDNLLGKRVRIAARSDAGQPTLCAVTGGPMIVCPSGGSHTGNVPVIQTLSPKSGDSGTPTGTVPRGSPITFWEYVHDGGGHGKAVALVTIDGQEGFIPDNEICFASTYPASSDVTVQLGMRTHYASQDPNTGQTTMQPTAAATNTYRPRSPDTIFRVVVHNTEEPFAKTMQDFTSGDKGTAAHVVLDRDGTLYRVVEDQFAAYQAGGSPDGMGNYNTTSLGVEVVAYDGSQYGGQASDANFLSDAQRASLVALIQAWMKKYNLQLGNGILQNTSSAAGYADLEYASAPVTMHRLTKASRGTDCPKFLFADSPDGDEAFFRWRQRSFGQ